MNRSHQIRILVLGVGALIFLIRMIRTGSTGRRLNKKDFPSVFWGIVILWAMVAAFMFYSALSNWNDPTY